MIHDNLILSLLLVTNQPVQTVKIDFFYEFITTELFIDKDVSKTDETLHDECTFKCRK
jgi:hypothetical protein